eukprot:COSAG01_NODE_5316_length_4320_cov_7.936792_4_plen_328_part_00
MDKLEKVGATDASDSTTSDTANADDTQPPPKPSVSKAAPKKTKSKKVAKKPKAGAALQAAQTPALGSAGAMLQAVADTYHPQVAAREEGADGATQPSALSAEWRQDGGSGGNAAAAPPRHPLPKDDTPDYWQLRTAQVKQVKPSQVVEPEGGGAGAGAGAADTRDGGQPRSQRQRQRPRQPSAPWQQQRGASRRPVSAGGAGLAGRRRLHHEPGALSHLRPRSSVGQQVVDGLMMAPLPPPSRRRVGFELNGQAEAAAATSTSTREQKTDRGGGQATAAAGGDDDDDAVAQQLRDRPQAGSKDAAAAAAVAAGPPKKRAVTVTTQYF